MDDGRRKAAAQGEGKQFPKDKERGKATNPNVVL